MKKEKRIPTILGLFLLLATLYVGNFVINRQINNSTKASGTCEPSNLQITNITHKSATVSFVTSLECSSAISITNQTVENLKGKSKVHYFEINSLEESKVYTFKIISGGETYSLDSYNFKTAQNPNSQIPSSNLAWGRVFKPDKTVVTQAIIYFFIPGASPLSALVNSSGEWYIALATSFNESLTDYFSSPKNTEEDIVVIDDSGNQTQIVNNTNRNNPVPDIIIGQNNFFSSNENIELPLDDFSEDETDFSDAEINSLTIFSPEENQVLSTARPDFFGFAKADSTLTIKVESPIVINGSIKTESDGTWNWTPSQDLTPGEHTVTVTDSDNNVVSKKFIVLAAESNNSLISDSTLAPTSIPTSAPTATPTFIPTSTPTRTYVSSSIPSTSSGVPKTGNSIPITTIIILSLFLFTSAFIYYKKN